MTPSPHDAGTPDDPVAAQWLRSARAQAGRAGHGDARSWMQCASDAWRALAGHDRDIADAAAALATQAADEVLARAVEQHGDGLSPGRVEVDGAPLQVEFRNVPPHLRPPLRIRRARDVPMRALDDERHARPGFGVPLATLSSGSADAPLDRLAPQSGAFRNLTAWIEPAAAGDDAPRLVLADPQQLDAVVVGAQRLTLARDTSAAYAWAMEISRLRRSGLWGLVGGKQIARRAGLYLLEDYDPGKRPLVMIHGLGSNPLIWAHVSNAVWGEDALRARYQIWQVVYQTDAPLLAARLRVQEYLDDAWRALDPGGEAKRRAGAVLLGHSMGGVIARLLCARSGDALWNAAFLAPPQSLVASAADMDVIRRIFVFDPYPGIARAIFLAAPHRGSPSAATVLGRVTGEVVGRRAAEVHALRRIANANAAAVRPELRDVFRQGWINSITTLQSEQPVRRAAEALLPVAGLPYHTIAGVQSRHGPQTDGVVPLDSALIPGAASSLVVESGHRVHANAQAVAEVLRILRE